MWESLRQRRILIIVSLFLLTALVPTLMERGQPAQKHGPISSVAMQSGGATQSLFAVAGKGVGGWWDRHMYLVSVHEENEKLRAERDRLREEHARLLGVMQENARLRALVGFSEAHPHFQLVPARVIARDVNEFFRVVTIKLDTGNARVRPDMPVVSSAGLVGQVESVDGRFAQVLLTVDKRSSVDIVVQRNRARGVLTGEGNPRDYSARIGYLLRRDEVRLGDTLVTSGMGGMFPPDLVIGTIADINDRNYGLYQEVRVEPAVDFSRLEEVYVVAGVRRE